MSRPRPGLLARLLALALAGAALVPSLGGCGPVQRPDGGAGPLPIGSAAPTLRAVDHRGQTIELAALPGPTLIYFYPRDGTPGCTREACAIRDVWDRFSAAGVTVLGVSSDSANSHAGFADEHKLPFSLIADTDLAWARAFGVEVSATIIHRTSFLLDRQGKVAKVYLDVDPGVHAEQVLADVAALPGSSAPEASPG